MNIYLAGSGWDKVWRERNFFDFCRLETFFGITKKETSIIHKYKSFMLDSGAFSLFGGKKINLNEYVDNYIRFINENNIDLFFELDIYALIGNDETNAINDRIERETKKRRIPVFHYFLGIDHYKKLCNEFKYISIGASGMYTSFWTRTHPKKLRKLIDYAHKKNVKVHGLGYTKVDMLHKMPFDSVDSTTWMNGNRYGSTFVWTGDELIQHKKRDGKRVRTQEVVVHNFFEWIKFCKHAEKNL